MSHAPARPYAPLRAAWRHAALEGCRHAPSAIIFRIRPEDFEPMIDIISMRDAFYFKARPPLLPMNTGQAATT